jgi:nucleoside phosphorylase
MRNLIVIETDLSFIEHFNGNLTKEGLDNEYIVKHILPDTYLKNHAKIIDFCVNEVSKYKNIYGIFIDICIIDGDNVPLGIDIALALREYYPQTPLFNITNKTKAETDFDAISVATLENIDGVFVKSFLENPSFSKQQFEKIFKKAQIKRAITSSTSSNKNNARNNSFDIAIITALDIPEFSEVKKLILNLETINKETYSIIDNTIYYKGEILGKNNQKLRVVLASDDKMGLPAISSLTCRIINNFRPKYLTILGIAAGIEKKTKIGDILISDICWDYGSGKWEEIDNNKFFRPSPYQLTLSEDLRTIITQYKSNRTVLDDIRNSFNIPRNEVLDLHIGPFASGSAVISSESLVAEIRDQHRKLIGFDMEIYGVFCAANSFNDNMKPKVIAIKSVSDFGTSDKNNPREDINQAYAAYTSVQFFKKFVENEID